MNNQKNKTEHLKKKRCSFLIAAVMMYILLSFLCNLAGWVAQWFGGSSLPIRNGATIGIIGGADGPTALLVTSSEGPVWLAVAKLPVLIAGIIGLFYLNKRK